MNKARRKLLEDIVCELDGIKERIDSVLADEQEAFESLQGGERGQQMEAAISAMENAAGSIDEAIGELGSAQE